MRIRGGEYGEGTSGRGPLGLHFGGPQRLSIQARDDLSATSTQARALELLVAAKPYRVTAGRKERMWLRMMPPSRGRSRRLSRPLIATGILTALLGGTAIADGALGHWPAWAVGVYGRLIPSLALNLTAAPPMALVVTKVGGLAKRSRVFAGEGNAETPPAVPAPSGRGQAVAAAEQLPPRHDATFWTRTKHTTHGLPSDDVTQVAAALHALRQNKDPAHARILLNGYLAAHPAGVLAEEALAISIEAALAAHDPDAPVLAARYLRLYPKGFFRTLGPDVVAPSEPR